MKRKKGREKVPGMIVKYRCVIEESISFGRENEELVLIL